MEEQVKMHMEEGNKDRGKCTNEILRRERKRREEATMRNTTGETGHTVIPKVDVPKGVGEIKQTWKITKELEEPPEEWEKVTG